MIICSSCGYEVDVTREALPDDDRTFIKHTCALVEYCAEDYTNPLAANRLAEILNTAHGDGWDVVSILIPVPHVMTIVYRRRTP